MHNCVDRPHNSSYATRERPSFEPFATATAPTSSATEHPPYQRAYSDSVQPALSQLYQSGSAARWRRKQAQEDYFSFDNTLGTKRLAALGHSRKMEEVHGVDVSWLHKPAQQQKSGTSAPRQRSASSLKQEDGTAEKKSGDGAREDHKDTKDQQQQQQQQQQQPASSNAAKTAAPVNPAHVTPPQTAKPERDTTTAVPSTPTPPPSTNGTPRSGQSKRPNILSRSSSTGKKEGEGRRSSWLNNLSSKFSSNQNVHAANQTGAGTPERPTSSPGQPRSQQNGNITSPPGTNGSAAGSPLPAHQEETEEQPAPYVPSKPKENTSFFSNLTRRLSSASSQNVPKTQNQGNGGLCQRRVLNVDPNRERCLVPEMDPSKLRKVSFCVDVEIASGPKYIEEEPEESGDKKQKKKKDAKLKERAEGEALKKPQSLTEEKDTEGEVKLDTKGSKEAAKAKAMDIPATEENNGQSLMQHGEAEAGASPPLGTSPDGEGGMTRKKEKKKKSEEERKDRKEKRRRKAEESGTIPVELQLGDDDAQASAGSSDSVPIANGDGQESAGPDCQPPLGSSFQSPAHVPANTSAPQQTNKPPVKQDRPTTDPVRIYRRCCQLRETPILKRITEQLTSPSVCAPGQPGVVASLDLTGSRLQLADVVTLGDWLAVVPVKNLRCEDADLNDEGVRCILAGLLAAKRPEPTRKKNVRPRHRELGASRSTQLEKTKERSGVVEKLTFKNNPRITRLGWKHISLFIYLCRSLKAIDLSMNFFPETLPAGPRESETKPKQSAPVGQGKDVEAAEIFYKCLSERLGGGKLEELIVSECGLKSEQIRKVVDGAIMCGISRLGLAGNSLDKEGLEHVLHYVRSGVCQGLDLGGNDLHEKLGMIADAMRDKSDIPCWGLSLAGCNLSSDDLQGLFPQLVKLPDFRFIDLSHNRHLCEESNDTISLFRRYMSQFRHLKRIHLADVGMSPKQAIALADCLPDGPRLAHLNLLENPELTKLANAKGETEQEEACALYASLMAAVRVSSTVICIDIDVPSQENSEVVKALAKQVVAYSLRNMEQFAIAEATGIAMPAGSGNAGSAGAAARAKLTEPHGGEKQVKDISVPDVLMHLVGHVEGSSENHDLDDPAPDDDYIVGGTGVVKALQYVLGEKANDLRRTSVPGTPTLAPRERPGSSAGLDMEEQRGKAKKMSKNLLESARKIRYRLQPALAKEATSGDELAYRRLLFLDQTLQSMIQRFEEEYPETRLPGEQIEGTPPPGSPKVNAGIASSSVVPPRSDLSINTSASEATGNISDEEDGSVVKPGLKRHGSEVSLASRAQTLEEGRLHRLGQHLRREVIDSPTALSPSPSHSQFPIVKGSANDADEQARITALGQRIESISGVELKSMVEGEGWESVLQKIGGNYDDLRKLQEQDPSGWEQFKESQMKARANVDQGRPSSQGAPTFER
ncbi:RNI-like protein [Hortaea werneckii]|nr:RNI-like protein [Hortaea werneckii]